MISPGLADSLVGLLDELAADAVGVLPQPGVPDIRASFLGGHPYWPDGSQWPYLRDEPMTFVGQINFADVPELPGFPSAGLLQWFVGYGDVAGMTFDDTRGLTGFHCNWLTDLSRPSLHTPTDRSPAIADGSDWLFGNPRVCPGYTGPYTFRNLNPLPYRLGFRRVTTLPSDVTHFTESQRRTLWEGLRAADLAGDEDLLASSPPYYGLSIAWIEHVRATLSSPEQIWEGAHIGGHPKFRQEDERGTGNFAAPDDPAAVVLIAIGDADLSERDATLFGDPRALATGDLSSLRYLAE